MAEHVLLRLLSLEGFMALMQWTLMKMVPEAPPLYVAAAAAASEN